MAIDGGFQEFLAEMFEPVGDVTFKSMFGGVGIFRYGLMFGLVFDDRVALKADQETEKDFLDEGLEQWTYSRNKASGTSKRSMGYWYIPERLLEDAEELRDWALKAFDVAVRADMKKPPSKRKLQG
ncbi:MAG: TfoX/Sxy family protein [Rhizobiaceae bacterium]|nr:TfoX/Sxy family protein [Rhizobiaceae bacterium]